MLSLSFLSPWLSKGLIPAHAAAQLYSERKGAPPRWTQPHARVCARMWGTCKGKESSSRPTPRFCAVQASGRGEGPGRRAQACAREPPFLIPSQPGGNVEHPPLAPPPSDPTTPRSRPEPRPGPATPAGATGCRPWVAVLPRGTRPRPAPGPPRPRFPWPSRGRGQKLPETARCRRLGSAAASPPAGAERKACASPAPPTPAGSARSATRGRPGFSGGNLACKRLQTAGKKREG